MDSGTLPAILTFDGIEEVAGGMRVNERVVEWPGQPGGIPAVQASGIDGETEFDLVDWEMPGEVVEFSFRTVSGEYISSDDAGQSFITIKDLNWQNSDAGSEPYFFETGFYMYYAKDGVPATGYETLLAGKSACWSVPIRSTRRSKKSFISPTAVVKWKTSRCRTKAASTSPSARHNSTKTPARGTCWPRRWAFSQMQGMANELHIGFLVDPPSGTAVSLPGDFNFDGVLDAARHRRSHDAVGRPAPIPRHTT